MNTHREQSASALPGKGLDKQGEPVRFSTRIKHGRGWGIPIPSKASNPALSVIGPWLVVPLALLCWGTLGYLAAAALHFIGGLTP